MKKKHLLFWMQRYDKKATRAFRVASQDFPNVTWDLQSVTNLLWFCYNVTESPSLFNYIFLSVHYV